MGTSLGHRSKVCVDPVNHRSECWLLESALQGLPLSCLQVTLNLEDDPAGAVWGWKIMRCGCTFVAVVL